MTIELPTRKRRLLTMEHLRIAADYLDPKVGNGRMDRVAAARGTDRHHVRSALNSVGLLTPGLAQDIGAMRRPGARAILDDEEQAQLLSMYAAGVKIEDAGRLVGVSRRTAQRIVTRYRKGEA